MDWVTSDLSRFEAEQERLEVEEAARRKEAEFEFDAALWSFDLDCKIDNHTTVEDAMEAADIMRDAFRALLEAAERGEKYALRAIEVVKESYLETV